MEFFKDNTALKRAQLTPGAPIFEMPPADTSIGRIVRTYNAVGGLIDTLAASLDIDPMAVLTVWFVESGGRSFRPERPMLRFENHKFWKYWGKAHADSFDRHFRFGGHGDIGPPHQHHAFRDPVNSLWRNFHGTQDGEYEVFDFACQLANREAACLSCGFGGAQIMGFNHDACGYGSAADLFEAFGADARWQVLGFFDFVRNNGLIHDIRDRLWDEFSATYNGDGVSYGALLAAAYAQKPVFEALERQGSPH